MQWWFCSAWPSEVDNDPMRALLKLILLQVYQKLPKTSTILWWFGIWSKLERWKSSITGASWVDWGKKKIIILKCRLPLLCIKTVNYFAIGQWCVMKSGFYRTTNDDQFSWWTEKTLQSISQSQACTHTHKKSQGHCLVVCWLSDPLQLWESRRKHITFKKHTQHISEIHWEMQHLQLALVNRKGSILLHDNARWHIT